MKPTPEDVGSTSCAGHLASADAAPIPAPALPAAGAPTTAGAPASTPAPAATRADVRFSAFELDDGSWVVRKTATTAAAWQRLCHERRMLERLTGVDGVAAPAAATAGLPEGGPRSLDLRVRRGRRLWRREGALSFAPADLAGLAAQFARILAAVHQRGVQHRNIHPGCLLWAGPGHAPALVDFELASTSAQSQPGFIHHSLLTGSLAYAAPEQSGRAGLAIDQRADLYALGASLYELACGEPPFRHDDPLELIRQHLTVQPLAPHLRVPGFPIQLSAVIMHLLEKSPDQRYQSAHGLAFDLELLYAGLRSGGLGRFTPGEHDFAERLAAPSRLIGREHAQAALAAALDRSIEGGTRCVLLSGGPGVGKTALLNTLRPLVTTRRGWYVAGKFDQLRQDQDTDAVRQALSALARLLLAEPEAALAAQRSRLRSALGNSVHALAAWSPELATLLGVGTGQDAAAHRQYAENQLAQSVVAMLEAIVSPGQPLVMVLDDLQWAAAPALRIVDALLQAGGLPGLLLVGALRAGEVDATHPLQARLARWDQLAAPPLRLGLDNLPASELAAMLGAMLRLAPAAAGALAALLAPRSGGNPFATVELVDALRREGSLRITAQGWEWDALAIQARAGQDEVVQLLHARMASLPDATRDLLVGAACLGGEAPLARLAVAAGISETDAENAVTAALEQGLLVLDEDGARRLRFRHDRVQQAAYTLLPSDAIQRRHLDGARRLAAHAGDRWLAAEQYLAACTLIDDAAERLAAARLFAAAGARLRLISHHMAERFSSAGLQLVAGLPADADPALVTALASEHHLALHNLGRLEAADQAFERVCAGSVDALDRIDATCLQITSLTQRGRARESVALGLARLGELGASVPTALDAALEHGLSALQASASASPGDLPEATEPRVVALAKLLDCLVIPSLQCDPPLNAWLAVETRRLWDLHGSCPALVRSAALTQPLVLQGRRQAYRAAHTLSKRILAVGAARDYGVATATARHVHAIATAHWFEPLEHTVEQARLAHEQLLRGGDLQFACLTFNATAPALLETGETLQACSDEVDAGLAFARRTGNQFAQGLYLNYRQLLRCLRTPGAQAGSFEADDFSEAEYLSGRLGSGSVGAMFHVLRALAAALFADRPRLASHAAAAQPLLAAIPGFYPTVWAHCLRALSLSEALRAEDPPLPAAEARAELARHTVWLEQRAVDQPGNFLALARWIRAEQSWAEGDAAAALRSFDDALAAALARRRPLQRALLCERAARCQLAHGLRHGGETLLAQAHGLYAAWGASAKCSHLQAEFPALRALAAATRGGELESSGGAHGAGHEIDLMAVVRASQLLSSETSLARLTGRVSGLMATMTGATAVQLLVRSPGTAGWLLLEASESAADAAEGAPPGCPVEQAAAAGRVPLSALRYAERTQAPLVVDDASRDDRFRRDPYFAALDCCALLVLPILNKGSTSALLLLENRFAAGRFAADQLDAVQLVAGQLAVSLENAQLYGALEARVAERTRELREAQARLVDTARRAGMAEIATNVLHNVGNVLNSVNVSAGLVATRLRASKAGGLAKAVGLMREHATDLGQFFTHDEKGQRLPGYLERLAQALEQERGEALGELEQLTRRIDHIKDIVATQQSYAGNSSVREPVRVDALLRDAVQMNEASMLRHGVRVELSIAALPDLLVDRPRMLQIVVNLLSNAKNACTDAGKRDGIVLLEAMRAGDSLRVCVSDNGIGIAPEDLAKVFAHGFTTRKDGHGFGLHSCVLAARDMGGTLAAHSAGNGLGARFQLDIPYREAHCA